MESEPDKHGNTGRALAVSILLAVTAHLLFSWFGFTPTDDGFTLSYSRRLLDGEVPHRDFIIIRPFVWPLLHLPEVLFGGSYTFWLSRLVVWIQFSVIAWSWSEIVARLCDFQLRAGQKIVVLAVIFAATSHNFPALPLHTVDGLFLLSPGILFCLHPRWKLGGYLLLGLACLCKQSFIFMPVVALIVLGDFRRVKYWIAIVFPSALYLAFLLITGAVADAVWQLTSRTDLLSAGIKRYLNNWLVFAGVGYAIVACLVTKSVSAHYRDTLNALAWILFPSLLLAIAFGTGPMYLAAFVLFGLVTGLLIFSLQLPASSNGYLHASILALGTAWSVSISEGYNTPALASGALFAITLANPAARSAFHSSRARGWLWILAVITLVPWGFGRLHYIYRDKSARYLDKPLGEVLAGGSLILTSSRTHAFLADLQQAVASVVRSGKRYVIIPDVAAFWVKSQQRNPLPNAWPQWIEISNEKNFARLIRSLEANRHSDVVIVQKVDATKLAQDFESLPENEYYAIVGYVRHHFEKVNETRFFELYQ